MEYNRRDFESYQDRYNRSDEDVRNRLRNPGYRQRNYDDTYPAYNRASNFPDTRSSERYQERDYEMEYPDRYSAGRSYANESYAERGARRSHLRCRDIMTRTVTTCNKNTRIQEIARLMREEDIGAVPVLDERGKLEGIVTDRDIIVKGLTSEKPDAELAAADCMSTDLFTANLNDRVVDVLRDMGDNQVRRVPVVDNRDRLVGIIAMADVATQTSRDRELEETLTDISKPSSFFGRLAYYLGM